MIAKIQSYKTSDNEIFESRKDAIEHEFFLDMRGLIHRQVSAGNNISTTDCAKMLIKSKDEIIKIIKQYNVAISRIKE
jgi:hypothetical protein